VKHKNT